MGFLDPVFNYISNQITDRVMTELGKRIIETRGYRTGKQPKQLKVQPNQYDDNLIVNYAGLIADRTVSQLVGEGVKFRVENENAGAESPQGAYLDEVWDANHQEILLHRAALSAVEAGTGYLFINDPKQGMSAVVDGSGQEYPRLMLVDPAYVEIETLPEDFEIVWRYTIQYKFVGVDGKERARKRVVEQDMETQNWTITTYEMGPGAPGWIITDQMEWPYPFGPMIHWQCLPSIDSAYGRPVLTQDVLDLQDSLNGNLSFLSKALRLGVHPMRWGRGLEGMQQIQTGPDKIVNVGPAGEIGQLPPDVDWEGALAFSKYQRQALFDITRTVDIDTLIDNTGDMTNFRLRVIYQDNKSKINTMRELMGDALEEINRRLLLMAGMEAVETEVVWPEFIPVNEVDTATYHQTLLGMGVESKQTAAEEIGLDWEQEQERTGEEQQAQDNVGSFLLKAFNRGQANTPPGMNGTQQQAR